MDILNVVLSTFEELSLKDALKMSAFDLVDDMFTCLYYVYEKSPRSVVN